MGGSHAGKQICRVFIAFLLGYAMRSWRVAARPNQCWAAGCDIRRRPVQHPSSAQRQPSDLPESFSCASHAVAPPQRWSSPSSPSSSRSAVPPRPRRLIDGGSIRKGTITSKQIKNGSVAKADLSKAAVRSLTETPPSSVRSAQIADGSVLAPDLGLGSVGPGQLAPGAVTASKLAADSVGGGSVANGSLQTVDIGSFTGSVNVDFRPFDAGPSRCQVAEAPGRPGRRPAEHRRRRRRRLAAGRPGRTSSSSPASRRPDNMIRIIACWSAPAEPTGPTPARRPSATSRSTRRRHRRAGSYRLHTNLPGGSEQRPPRSSSCRSPPEPPVDAPPAPGAPPHRRGGRSRRSSPRGWPSPRWARAAATSAATTSPSPTTGAPSQSDDGAGAAQSGGESQSDGFGPPQSGEDAGGDGFAPSQRDDGSSSGADSGSSQSSGQQGGPVTTGQS